VNQKVALRFLGRLGYRADAVANGLAAVVTLERRHYDFVLMDVQMPDMDGYEATRQIRKMLPADRQPRIIAPTTNAMQGDRELCVAAGMDDHISKPVKMNEIAAAIRRYFGKSVPSDRQKVIGEGPARTMLPPTQHLPGRRLPVGREVSKRPGGQRRPYNCPTPDCFARFLPSPGSFSRSYSSHGLPLSSAIHLRPGVRTPRQTRSH
jgi:CheY-like chemotaxis protein